MNYIAIIHKDEDSDYGVSFPDFPGCISAGRTLEDAKHMALEALVGHIAVMREAGLPLPSPSALDDVRRQPGFQDGLPFLVPVAALETTAQRRG
jgi:predicted RNase H-like HicB family nuclease